VPVKANKYAYNREAQNRLWQVTGEKINQKAMEQTVS
jgi:hypothetical protein